MIEFLRAGNKNYTKKDLIATLEKLEIQEGDTICVHTELFKFGTALLPKKQHLSVYIEAMLDVIGKNGTLIMPVFSYSFCKNEVYDKHYSKSKVGVLNEFFRLSGGGKKK